MTELDDRGYPPEFQTGWWKCPECGGYYHDSQQRGNPSVAWDMASECGPCGGIEMVRVDDTERDPSTLRAMAERWENVPAYRATRPPSIAENLRHVAKQMEAATAMEEAGEP